MLFKTQLGYRTSREGAFVKEYDVNVIGANRQIFTIYECTYLRDYLRNRMRKQLLKSRQNIPGEGIYLVRKRKKESCNSICTF